MRRLFIVWWVLCVGITVARAQFDPAQATPLRFSEAIDGYLDANTPQSVFVLDGRRGEYIRATLLTLEGTLQPTLTVIRSNGEIVASGFDGLPNGVYFPSIQLPASDRYFFVVARFGGLLGNTQGRFQLEAERLGVSSESGSSLRYDDTVMNTIDDAAPQHYYSFRAQRGDILNIEMKRTSGNLDPYLQVVNADRRLIASSDDILGGTTLDAGINGLVIASDGMYLIVASRYGEDAGESEGTFVLTIQETDTSGLGNTPVTAADLAYDTPITEQISAQNYEKFYRFYAEQDDILEVRMERLDGTLDPYLELLNDSLQSIAVDDDGGAGKNAQLTDFRIPTSGLYYLRATRFELSQGSGTGQFRLTVQKKRYAFEGVSDDAQRLLYGTTVTGTINDEMPSALYAFWGVQGDRIAVSMTRADGNLNAMLGLYDSNFETLLVDDDSGGGQNARIERFTLPSTGIYYIRAMRNDATDGIRFTRGSYILILAQRFD